MKIARISLPAILLAFAAFLVGMKVSDPPGLQLSTFADSFLGTLDNSQKSLAMMEYDSPQRVDWHFIPKKTRKGLVMREMNAAQRTAALRLVRAALSEIGYDKASRIMLLEGVLNKLEGDRGSWERDPEKYYLTIFGTPSETGAWGLSFEGHHLSLNFSCRGGEVVDSTPQFFASNPATVMDDVPGPIKKGTRVLRDEEQMGFDLVNSLNEDQQKQAILSDKALKEIRFAGEAQATVDAPEGIPLSELDEKQQKQLKTLIMVYINAVAEKVAERRRDQIEKNGWDNVHFAWAGATEPGIGHYYRIRGQEFLIEFVNTQADAAGNPANHIHAVWRDVTGDFDLPAKP
jgi:hypothetical protein